MDFLVEGWHLGHHLCHIIASAPVESDELQIFFEVSDVDGCIGFQDGDGYPQQHQTIVLDLAGRAADERKVILVRTEQLKGRLDDVVAKGPKN